MGVSGESGCVRSMTWMKPRSRAFMSCARTFNIELPPCCDTNDAGIKKTVILSPFVGRRISGGVWYGYALSRLFYEDPLQEPGRSGQVRFIPGDPSAKARPHDDSLLSSGPSPQCVKSSVFEARAGATRSATAVASSTSAHSG